MMLMLIGWLYRFAANFSAVRPSPIRSYTRLKRGDTSLNDGATILSKHAPGEPLRIGPAGCRLKARVRLVAKAEIQHELAQRRPAILDEQAVVVGTEPVQLVDVGAVGRVRVRDLHQIRVHRGGHAIGEVRPQPRRRPDARDARGVHVLVAELHVVPALEPAEALRTWSRCMSLAL